jgi:type I restriction enzyme S subunit
LQGTEWDYTRQEHEVKRSLAEISGTLKILENSLNDSGLNTVGDTTMTLLSSVASAYRVSVNPMKFADEEFDLYSIPSFDDSGKPELAKGSEIGSNKLLIRKPSILISRLNPRTPRIWVARPGVRRAICSTEFTVLEVENNELFSSIFIALHSQVATTYLKSVARGTTGSRKRARESDLMNIRLPLTPSIESPISAAAKELVNLKEQLINGLCLIQEIIPEVADETYRKSTD